jgi:hypothetical protein
MSHQNRRNYEIFLFIYKYRFKIHCADFASEQQAMDFSAEKLAKLLSSCTGTHAHKCERSLALTPPTRRQLTHTPTIVCKLPIVP